MKRRDVLSASGAAFAATMGAASTKALATREHTARNLPNLGKPVRPPSRGPVEVAFVIGPNTVLIDLAGPWEAFNDAMVSFHTYTVAAGDELIDMGGINARPDYTFESAPRPHVIVVPAQQDSPQSLRWIEQQRAHADITMSICTGAFLLAKAGLLDGLPATTHHGAYNLLASRYPKIDVIRGPRFVETRDISTSGGETSGIDLALRVVERYFGEAAAASSATNMEHVRTSRPWS